jgi:hypothetical protein
MLVRHELAEIGAVESPGIDHLFAMVLMTVMVWPAETKAALPRRAGPRRNFDK